jgi:hypothetical protein
MGWGMAQVVDHLPGKHKTLSSNPTLGEKKKKKGWQGGSSG